MYRVGVVLVAIVLGFGGANARAQTGTPVSGGCQIEPRTSENVNALAVRAATPVETVFRGSVRMPGGEPVDESTTEQLLATLNEANACAEARDLLRFLALYTDEFIVSSILAPEPASLIPGAAPGNQTSPAGTPVAGIETLIDDAVLLDDGRIAAHVFTGGSRDFGSIVWFVESGDRWLIDDMASSANPPEGTTDVPAEAESLVALVIADAAAELGVNAEEIELVSVKSVSWPDAALGCPAEGGTYAAVVTPGYRIIVSDGSSTLAYHTDTTHTIVRCDTE